MFTFQVEKRSKPSTLAKQGSHVHNEYLIERDFEFVDLEASNEPSNMKHIIKEKDSQIKEIIGDGADEMIIEKKEVTLKAEVFSNPELKQKFVKMVGMEFPEFFVLKRGEGKRLIK